MFGRGAGGGTILFPVYSYLSWRIMGKVGTIRKDNYSQGKHFATKGLILCIQ